MRKKRDRGKVCGNFVEHHSSVNLSGLALVFVGNEADEKRNSRTD